ncbi:MAG: DUF4920 domain-containing protein [Bacteroidetes bacterium]|nr:DUF4920 domain-containing protein [Bacteroidota bacterium]MCB9042733.1 DUF4920 domain-containing protein [Chitinophagales bacterium]
MRSFGEQITADGAISMASLTEKMQQTTSEQQAKVEGNVAAVCQVKGCWMNLYQPDSSTMRVTFKDYAFFMPKDIEGKKVIVEGIAKYDTTSVEDLRHFAEDEGKSAEEIAAISAPAVELVFEANGVLLEP